MNIRGFKTVAGLALVLAVSFFMATGANAQSKMSFSIVTGGTGGVWYPLGGAIGGIVGKYVPNTEASSEATTAAIDNLKLLTAGKAGLAFAYDYHVVWANEGKVPGLAGKHNVRMVLGFYEQPLHIVTTSATGLTNVMQLKGMRVSTCAPNSGT
ncbi:MAG: TAXI family TRAP transporter solute-binding subunit, partial [Phycisphaerales bacterium]